MLADGPLLGDELDCFTGEAPRPLGGTVGRRKEKKRAEQCRDHNH